MPDPPQLRISYPAWVHEHVDWGARLAGEDERVRVALALARQNVVQGSGGPFGAAIFEQESGRLLAVGINLVVPLNNSVLHAEIVAFMMAEASLGSWTLGAPGGAQHALYSSCEPCAMCLGATLWAGVTRVVWSATREEARLLGFDEGPVFPQSYDYLRRRGLSFEGGVLRSEGRAVLQLYRDRGGIIYNG
jgi:tRNA(Arg) A34 adenosine deaminase TadA